MAPKAIENTERVSTYIGTDQLKEFKKLARERE